MKRYIIEVPEEIRSCAVCPLKRGNIRSRCNLSFIDVTDAAGLRVVAHSCPLQETTMKSQAEIEERIQQQYSMLNEDDCTDDFNSYNAMWSEYNLLNWVLGK